MSRTKRNPTSANKAALSKTKGIPGSPPTPLAPRGSKASFALISRWIGLPTGQVFLGGEGRLSCSWTDWTLSTTSTFIKHTSTRSPANIHFLHSPAAPHRTGKKRAGRIGRGCSDLQMASRSSLTGRSRQIERFGFSMNDKKFALKPSDLMKQ
ncbi:hypothetical protein CEXT_189231 [Caerostris extrusa]|uniref:Uncharacterized protein n=1 Tax=Caerostris extrusa TaxID=172846 RepID=A0AAV4VHK6_CAEEX|nr:hypothetical protein CEXT_189231 [Caerostris extrusa]